MSRRREVKGKIEALHEIYSIMESMKNLAMMESRKLARYHQSQQQVVDTISRALNEVRCHYAHEEQDPKAQPVYLLFGSERGFCGAYNQQLLQTLSQQADHLQAPVIGVGSRLIGPMQRDYPNGIYLPGAAVADEVAAVLTQVVATLNQLRQEHGPLRLEVIHFQPDSHQPECKPALPPLEKSSIQGLPPLINLPPQQLLSELLEHYLFALAHTWLFASLMAENQRRMQHLDQAGHHLEQQLEELGKRSNALRQEEIIEEIEVILLNTNVVGVS